jgi:hypothetical protein
MVEFLSIPLPVFSPKSRHSILGIGTPDRTKNQPERAYT